MQAERRLLMSDQMQEYIDEAEKDLLHTYNRYQVVLDRGEGVYLYDINGKKCRKDQLLLSCRREKILY